MKKEAEKRYTLRTRFGDIVAEFLPPLKRSNKVVIFCGGMPGVPRHDSLLRFLSRKGYWIFYPRYRGSWESGGRFLKISPDRDVIDVMDALPHGIKNLWDGKKYQLEKPFDIYLIGGSFGGPAVILASRDERVRRVVAVSPVIDWRARTKAEPIEWMEKFTRSAFGGAYRFSHKDWMKLKKGEFYNPSAHVKGINGKKLFLIYAKDDKVVPYRPTMRFIKQAGANSMASKRGGHLSASTIMKPAIWRKVRKFLHE